MDSLKIFFDQYNSSNSLTLIIIYILVILVAFGICVLASYKLKIYSNKRRKVKPNSYEPTIYAIVGGASDSARYKRP
ncbi:hypothetical protein SAMN05421659_11874 [[Clostridium] fimetarium]|uniref:Uncharacterized protein n=1 Tax=[Clostridium] fimetarium TaxID=99656 RepID=A0A1I0RLR3_9FIRM|nr:hypothetical protein SAMN05421659_11874 [[Clostridium] fimetarium]